MGFGQEERERKSEVECDFMRWSWKHLVDLNDSKYPRYGLTIYQVWCRLDCVGRYFGEGGRVRERGPMVREERKSCWCFEFVTSSCNS